MMYLAYTLLTLHMFVGIFLIGLILLQRGRGGGLAGAFGGMGGQSAFGTKAGDIFTRITIGVAVFWILLACVCILVVGQATKNRAKFLNDDKAPVKKAPAEGMAGEKEDDAADNKSPENGGAAGADKATAPANPDKANPPAKQPDADEKKPVDNKGEEAAGGKKPDNAEAKPSTTNPDAPAGAKENDTEKSATPKSSDTKPPE